MVDVFDHNRYKHCMSDKKHVHTVLLNSINLLRPALIILDSYWVQQTSGVLKGFQEKEKRTPATSQNAVLSNQKDFKFIESVKKRGWRRPYPHFDLHFIFVYNSWSYSFNYFIILYISLSQFALFLY